MKPTIIDSLRGRDLLSLAALSREEFCGLLESGLELKRAWKRGERPRVLEGKTIAMIFEKQSLRTRSTFDIAMYQLGRAFGPFEPELHRLGRARDGQGTWRTT